MSLRTMPAYSLSGRCWLCAARFIGAYAKRTTHSSVPCDDESLLEPVFDGESGVTVRVSLCPGDDDNVGLSVTPAFRQS